MEVSIYARTSEFQRKDGQTYLQQWVHVMYEGRFGLWFDDEYETYREAVNKVVWRRVL